MSAIKNEGGLEKIDGLRDILEILDDSFPKAGAAAKSFINALKNGEGIIAAFKGGLSGLWNVISAQPILATKNKEQFNLLLQKNKADWLIPVCFFCAILYRVYNLGYPRYCE